MSQDSINFDQIIAPMSRARFMEEYWTKKFLLQKGEKGRFTPILPWEELNRILEWHPPPQPQLRMFQEGVMVDVRRYIDGPVGALKLNAGGLVAALAEGATMILDAVHEVAPKAAALRASMEEVLACECVSNLYAGWRSQRGFNVHWDGHEVFVLQLSGRKRWQVFGPTRLHPLEDDIEKGEPPDGPPLWEGILEDGDLLYLPRGFWHVAYPLDEPSLHISWGAQPYTGVEFTSWWTRRLRRHREVRASLVNMDQGQRRAYVEQLVGFMKSAAAGDPLGDFLKAQAAGHRPAPHIRLPQAPVEQGRPLRSVATRVRLAGHDALFIEQEPGEPMAKFYAAGNWWFIRPEFIAAFSRLSGKESVAFQELAALIADKSLVGMMAAALDTMAGAGLVFKEEAVGQQLR